MSERLNLIAANFNDTAKKGRVVPWISFNGENAKLPGIGRGYAEKAGCSPIGLLALLTASNRDELIAECRKAIADAERVNGPAETKTKAAPSAPATVYYTSDNGVVSAPIIDANVVRAFALANFNNPTAAIHCNGSWHMPSQWDSIGFAPPPAPPAPPVAPSAPVAPPAPSAPVAPSAPSAPAKQPSALEKIVQSRQLATA